MNDKEYAIGKLDKVIEASKKVRDELRHATGIDNPMVEIFHAYYHDLIDIKCSVEKLTVPFDQFTTEDRIKQLYNCHTTAGWARGCLKIVVDMLEAGSLDGEPPSREWLIKELSRVRDGIQTIKD